MRQGGGHLETQPAARKVPGLWLECALCGCVCARACVSVSVSVSVGVCVWIVAKAKVKFQVQVKVKGAIGAALILYFKAVF